MFIRKKVMS